MHPAKRIIDFLGLRRSMVGLLAMVVLVGLGERMPERFLPKYVESLGGAALGVGLLAGLKNLLGGLYSYPGGYLADRLGTKRALLVFNLLTMAGFLIVILVPTWPAVIVGAMLFLSWSAISLPATMSLVASVMPSHRRTMGVSVLALVRRFPMALGPVAGGAFITLYGLGPGVRLAFGVALAMAVVAIPIQHALIHDDRARARPGGLPPAPTPHPLAVARSMTPALRNLLLCDVLIRFCEQIPDSIVILWCTEIISGRVSDLQFGSLTAIEMATAVLVYVPVAYFADRLGKKPFVLATFVFFALFPLALLFCRSFWPLVAAFVLRGLKEFGEPSRKALILELAPQGREAVTFGVYYLIRDTITSVAAFGGAFLYWYSPTANFLAAFAFGVLGTVWFALRGRDLTGAAQAADRAAQTSGG